MTSPARFVRRTSLAVAALVSLSALALGACDRITFGQAEPDPKARVTTTVTTTLQPTTTAQQTVPTPAPGAFPPDGPGAYGAVDASRYLLSPPTSVATYAFSVPSGNIACFAGTEFICEIHDGPDDSPEESRCGLYEGAERPVRIVGWFNYASPPCSTILQGVWRDPGPVLGYGESLSITVSGAQFTCYSSTEALYCRGPQDYGFTLSRTEFARTRLG
ncbi:hypothetical protein [Gordonia sp. (in: high G+C Gram-positive bacteria)]|uniref:hypothetical protein n=1 Tax=Gordonia sp. (in: high G+C Gram-positive bacteria) TaxID=84139 RepID=UPI0039E5B4A6